jgi:uncharacterized protein YjbI with pentapeptide repeats
MAARLSWQESWRFLAARGGMLPAEWPSGTGDLCNPRPTDEFHRPCLCAARHEETDFENLTLPRTLFLRCRFHGVSFRNSDFNQACLCGEFIDCDFSEVDLTCSHLAQAGFFACRFINARLIGAELRGAGLEHCDFQGADLTGARLDRALKDQLELSDLQRQRMADWRAPDDIGPDEEEDEDE